MELALTEANTKAGKGGEEREMSKEEARSEEIVLSPESSFIFVLLCQN